MTKKEKGDAVCTTNQTICCIVSPPGLPNNKLRKDIRHRRHSASRTNEQAFHLILHVKLKKEEDSPAKDCSQCEINLISVVHQQKDKGKIKGYAKQNVNGYQYSCIPSCVKVIIFFQQERGYVPRSEPALA